MRLRRKNKVKAVDEKRLGRIIAQELNGYVKREELQEYLSRIERDKNKKELWDSLPARKRIKLLRHALEKKGAQYGKK